MLKDDWVMRQIQQLVTAVVNLRRAKKEETEDPELETTDDLLKKWSGMPAVMLERLDGPGLVDAMSPAGKLDLMRAIAVGLLLEEQADRRSVSVLAAAAAAGGESEIERLRAQMGAG